MASAVVTESISDNNGNKSLLLGLPMELLKRVTDPVSDETLLMLRLTCKTIELATFDRFAKTYFEERFCYIYHEARWTLLRDVLASRLADNIGRVVFTIDVLEPFSCVDLQLAPYDDWGQYDQYSAQDLAELHMEQSLALPSNGIIDRCLLDLRNFAPKALVAWNVGHDFLLKNVPMTLEVLLRFATNGIILTDLDFAVEGMIHPMEALLSRGHDITLFMSSLQSLSYEEPTFFSGGGLHYRQDILAILVSVKQLHMLTLRMNGTVDAAGAPNIPRLTTADLLLANDFHYLKRLTLDNCTIASTDLVVALSSCALALNDITLSRVMLTRKVKGGWLWQDVFGVLSSMLRLASLYVSYLLFGVNLYPNILIFKMSIDGKEVVRLDMDYEGREQVISGLEEMARTACDGGLAHRTPGTAV